METQVPHYFIAAFSCTAFAAFVGYWLIWAKADPVTLTGALVKTASTGFLVLAGAAMLSPAWVILGLAFGAIGDFCLARRGERAFLAGMAAFAIGHLAYAFHLISVFPTDEVATHISQYFAALALAILWRSTEGWLIPHTGALRWPVRGYTVAILVMGIAACLLPSHPGNHAAALIRLGAFLFILSDFLLSLRLFVVTSPKAQRGLSLSLWPAYWCGQGLILIGATLYAQPFGPV